MNQVSAIPFGTDATVMAGYAQRANERLGNVDLVLENTGVNNAYVIVKELTTSAAVKASATTVMGGTNNDLVFTAKSAGAAGNNITITLIDPAGASKPLLVSVGGTAITVYLATSGGSAITTTATQLKAAIEANNTASNLVTVANAAANDGSGVVTALALTNLSGGSDATESYSTLVAGFTVAAKGTITKSLKLVSKRIGFFGSGVGGSTAVNISTAVRNPADLRGAQIDIVAGGRRGWGYDTAFDKGTLTKNWGAPPDRPSDPEV